MLAIEYNMPVPEWVLENKYFLKEPFFLGRLNGRVRILTIIETPVLYKRRNIFLDKNTFSRV